MNNIILNLPPQWYIARLQFLEKQIKESDCLKLGTRKGVPHIRRTNCKPYEISMANKEWPNLYQLALRRENCISEFKTLKQELHALYGITYDAVKSNYIVLPNNTSKTFRAWEKLVDNECPIAKDRPHPFKNHVFRSRFEMTIAESAENMHLKYKYEPGISLGSSGLGYDTKYPDFVFGFQEFNCFTAVEAFGQLDSQKYVNRNCDKMKDCIMAGFYPNRDIFVIGSDTNYMPNPDFIRASLINMINILCTQFVARKQ